MIDASKVTAVIPTRGDVDMTEIRASLAPFGEVIIWDNSKWLDRKVYSRYLAARAAKHRWIYTQDDDCLVSWPYILEAQGPHVVCNMPAVRRDFYNDGVNLVGWGSLFCRTAPDVLEGYLGVYDCDELFLRSCDRVFTKISTCKQVDVPFAHLPHAFDANRMGGRNNQRQNLDDLAELRRRMAVYW